jgi:hypothetical protein
VRRIDHRMPRRAYRWLNALSTAAMVLLASKQSWAVLAARSGQSICVYDAWPLRPVIYALSSTQAHALIASTLVALGILYVLIPEDMPGIRQVLSLAVGAISGAAALQVIAYLFPYSPALF